MKKIKVLALCAIVAGFATSCQKNEISDETAPEAAVELTKDHKLALLEAGVNPYNAVYSTVNYPDGTSKKGIAAGTEGYRDIFIALDDLANQALADTEDGNKQYRTRNLVSQNRTIRVTGWNGSGNALTSKMRTGLQWAVNNYNRLNISLNFVLTFGTDQGNNVDMVVYNAGGTNAGGQAEFPNGGRPGKYIQIFGGMDRFNENVNEHVMTHEMGHAVGFRHTDYARRRCDNSNEGSSSVGAIHIPGTPTENRWGAGGLDSNSIMISCFGNNENGEFSGPDITALEFMY